MGSPENMLAASLDEIIRRSTMRLEQETLHVQELDAAGPQHRLAEQTLARGQAALSKLKAYRLRFD